MIRFKNGQRVRVKEFGHHLHGRTGTVVRLRHADNAAWVNMDADLPKAYQAFPDGDSRARHAMLYPDDCMIVLPSTPNQSEQ